ncbi:MAG: hypothetical protein IT442_17280 [Phycisphaeraceae bacterium]|nr:hypothetical protein [Phycisphaeraceae bacterium]
MSTARRRAWIVIATVMLLIAVGRVGVARADGLERPAGYALAQSVAAENTSSPGYSATGRNHYPESGAVLLLLIAATFGARRLRWHWRHL